MPKKIRTFNLKIKNNVITYTAEELMIYEIALIVKQFIFFFKIFI